eukprot:TRINITY_DN5245_c0_g1_i1.p2 TRINITY_DN5245_c0_g1~~TRINITY_DN5245_c0_g1_i1.p2  ORF type:complete len:156 (+),score=30.09 TRINITY_DN5245_c0_g1_i1:103-570(+)
MAEPLVLAVTVPEGVAPGTSLNVNTPCGQTLQVQVPEGCAPGTAFHMQYFPVSEEQAKEMSDLQLHPEDTPSGIDAAEVVPASMENYGEEGRTYFTFQPAAYNVGKFLQVLRSSGEYTDCCIHHVHLTAMGPLYDVDVGGVMKCGVPENDLHVPA